MIFEILSKVLSVNTDFYTMWNFRRQILLDLFTPENKKELSMAELKLTETTLEKSPKSYCVWNHRRWICENGEVDLANELQLCNKFLKLDSRNCIYFFIHLLSHFMMAIEFIAGTIEGSS